MNKNETKEGVKFPEISEPLNALARWTALSKKRIAFITVGEIAPNGFNSCTCLLGRADRIAYVLYGNAQKDENFATVLDLSSNVKDSPMMASLLSTTAQLEEETIQTHSAKGGEE